MRTVVLVAAAMAAAWIAAGSLGWMAPPLQKILTWLALGTMMAAAAPAGGLALRRWALLAAVAAVLALLMTATTAGVVNVLAVAVVLAMLAQVLPAPDARAVLAAGAAVMTLAAYRLLVESTATVWAAAEGLGGLLGRCAGWMTGRPLSIGASFAGLDFLVVMVAFLAVWVAWTRPRGWRPVLGAAAAIAAAHGIYLALLAVTGDLLAALPPVALPELSGVSHLGIWTWGNAVRGLLPWHLPVAAAVLHGTVAAVMVRLLPWQSPTLATRSVSEAFVTPSVSEEAPSSRPRSRFGLGWGDYAPATLALVAAMALGLTFSSTSLDGRRIVVYDLGGVDFSAPASDAPDLAATASLGLLPPLVESLGGELVRSTDLSAEELARADVVLLLPPGPKARPETIDASDAVQDRHWIPEAVRSRLVEYVRGGGSLLAAAEPEGRPGAIDNVLNEVLAETSIDVGDDAAVSLTGYWEGSAAPLARGPTASLRAAWPAEPWLQGRWGLGQPGAVTAEKLDYRPGRRLGDLVLGARQRLGRGTVVVLGGNACLKSDWLPSSYAEVSRLLAGLAARQEGPLGLLRQLLGVAALAGMLVLVARRPAALDMAAAAAILAGAVLGLTLVTQASSTVLPEGRPTASRPVAYIDGSRPGAISGDPTAPDGTARLSRVLTAAGYLPLVAPDLSPARLQQAAVLVSIAPGRPFSATEQQTVKQFVESGGLLVSMAGALEAGPSLPLLGQFGLGVPTLPVPPSTIARETTPLGRFSLAVQREDGGQAVARFYAGWPVRTSNQGKTVTESLWKLPEGTVRPLVVEQFGDGAAILLGDTCFALNKNLGPPKPEEDDGEESNTALALQCLMAKAAGRPEPPMPKAAASPAPVKTTPNRPMLRRPAAGKLPAAKPGSELPTPDLLESTERGLIDAPEPGPGKPDAAEKGARP